MVDSLALAYRRAVQQVQELSGRVVSVVRVVGGRALNELLCQATADACGLPVLAGPGSAALQPEDRQVRTQRPDCQGMGVHGQDVPRAAGPKVQDDVLAQW